MNAGPRDRARAVPVAAGRWARWTASRSAPHGWTPAATAGRSARRGRVVAFVGSNLMKFGPLLGELLAQAVLSDELPDELIV